MPKRKGDTNPLSNTTTLRCPFRLDYRKTLHTYIPVLHHTHTHAHTHTQVIQLEKSPKFELERHLSKPPYLHSRWCSLSLSSWAPCPAPHLPKSLGGLLELLSKLPLPTKPTIDFLITSSWTLNMLWLLQRKRKSFNGHHCFNPFSFPFSPLKVIPYIPPSFPSRHHQLGVCRFHGWGQGQFHCYCCFLLSSFWVQFGQCSWLVAKAWLPW